MLTRLETLMIKKVPLVGVYFLEKHWFHGLEKNKISYLYIQQRQNTLLLRASFRNLSR